MTIAPNAALLRGFAVDLLSAHQIDAGRRIMAESYRLDTGGHALIGRDEAYLPAIAAQLAIFPGLGLTVHELLLSANAAALRFTEHGASVRQGGRAAAWGGTALFRIAEGRLQSCWAEEDYWGRKRQLDAGAPDAIEPPHPAPWDTALAPADPSTEAAARAWLDEPGLLDALAGPAQLEAHSVAIDALVAVADRAAFHVTVAATYRGGFGEITASDQPVRFCAAGILDVADGSITAVRAVADWLGLHKALAPRTR